jgi:hypothetical protein
MVDTDKKQVVNLPTTVNGNAVSAEVESIVIKVQMDSQKPNPTLYEENYHLVMTGTQDFKRNDATFDQILVVDKTGTTVGTFKMDPITAPIQSGRASLDSDTQDKISAALKQLETALVDEGHASPHKQPGFFSADTFKLGAVSPNGKSAAVGWLNTSVSARSFGQEEERAIRSERYSVTADGSLGANGVFTPTNLVMLGSITDADGKETAVPISPVAFAKKTATETPKPAAAAPTAPKPTEPESHTATPATVSPPPRRTGCKRSY